MPMLIDVAELAGLAAEGTLYGVFVCLFCVCSYDLVRRRARYGSQLSWPMIIAGVLLILLATARFAVDTSNVFVAFIHHDPRSARIAYLADVTQPLFTTKHSILIAVLLVGDSFVNYRCWVVWGKTLWVIILPVILSLISAVSGSYTMWAYSNLPNQTVLSEATWLKAFFSLSLVANAIATSLLAFRIWYVDRQMARVTAERAQGSSLTPIVRIILESGMINAAYLFVYVMTLNFGSQGLEIMSEMATPLTGIIFSIVILRVGHQRHDDNYYTQHPSRTMTWNIARKSETRVTGLTGTTMTALTGADSNIEVYVHGNTTSKVDDETELHSISTAAAV
ncbi:hypothetical protein BD311DRAFT_758701 [Dichomitus squalens]|uniref:Uncharacterized protein n=1 Tax=Dichomitus squalens TaxID=114155 RepID=A0A4Q9MQ46_9APHY|nr:hypothetical protein BD311DRAFT_758701 [Dichomitus squalens]